MATVKLFLREDRTNKAGEAPLYIRIIQHRKPKYLSLDFRLPPKFWNQQEQKIKSSYPHSNRFNAWLKKQVANVMDTYINLQEQDKNVQTKDIKKTILGSASPQFLDYGYKYIHRNYYVKGQESTFERYRTALNKLKEYLNGKDFTFRDLSLSFLKDYAFYLETEKDNVHNTVTKDFKALKRIIKEAINDEIIPYEKNPFLKYPLKWKKSEKVYLTEMELSAIERCPIDEGLKMAMHRDVFVFASYVGGLRISDLCRVKWINFDGIRISMTTLKTKTPISVKLPNKALHIINKYQCEDRTPADFIFPILNKDEDKLDNPRLFKKINSKNSMINNSLNVITERVGLEKHISFHTSRHTWATRALRKGMPIHLASRILGHASVKTTEVYAKIVSKDLDDAMDIFNN